jgi:ADP-heptose:LPS heptosyltransferase
VTGTELAGLAGELGLVDDLLPGRHPRRLPRTAADRARVFARAAWAARRWRPDAAATFKAAAPWAALAAASGARHRAGLARGPVARALLTAPVDPPPDRHHEERYADVARSAGADPAVAVAPRWPGALPAAAAGLFAGGAPVVALAPGGARNVKEEVGVRRWAVERWAALAAALAAERGDLRFALLGAPGDRAEAERVLAALPAGRGWDLVGHTSVAEARAVTAGASACVVHDSGLLHVAATTLTNVVAVFGPSDPRVMCPRRPGVTPVWDPARPTACQDGRTGAVRACVTPCCMERVSLGAVLAAVRAALGESEAGAPPVSLVGG